MNALDLLSDDEDDASVEESTEAKEPDTKRQKVAQLDFKDLQRVGYAVGSVEDDKSKMENAFSSFEKAAASKNGKVVTEIPGFSTTYQILKDGDRAVAAKVVSKGCQVTVHALGAMAKTGKIFWESRETQSGKPHLFMAGDGDAGKEAAAGKEGSWLEAVACKEVIDSKLVLARKQHLSRVVGWEQGCLGMRIGEVRKLSIPSYEGYGERGLPEWEILPHCDLEFTIECLDIVSLDGPTVPMIPNWRMPSTQFSYRYPSSSTSTRYSA